MRWLRRIGLFTTVVAMLALTVSFALGSGPGSGAPAPPPDPDPSQGQTLSVVPPGNNGLVNVGQLVAFETKGARPANSEDQYKMYEDLPYNANLSEAQLSDYYRPETFDLAADQVASTEQPSRSVPPPNMPWQNRPTFQQVATFPTARPAG
jgi:hypothetical protein